jgi:hypothetical protein
METFEKSETCRWKQKRFGSVTASIAIYFLELEVELVMTGRE